jgi:DNA polymerase-3 subunit delta'
MLILSFEQLENFDRAYRLLELNSRPQTVLAQILMSFVGDKNASA